MLRFFARWKKVVAGDCRAGFSLIEVLTATAVLAIILVLMVQITDGILSSTRTQNRQLDSVAAARRALDTLTIDFATALFNTEATALLRQPAANQPFLAMVCNRPGPVGSGAGNHRFLAVQYEYNPSEGNLYRNYKSVLFDSSSENLLQRATGSGFQTPSIPIAQGILGLSVEVLTMTGDKTLNDSPSPSWAAPNLGSPGDRDYNGLQVPSGWLALIPPYAPFAARPSETSTAIRVWIAATEPQTLELLEKTGKLTNALTIFNNHSPKDWRAVLDQSSLPPAAKSSTRILQRTFPLH